MIMKRHLDSIYHDLYLVGRTGDVPFSAITRLAGVKYHDSALTCASNNSLITVSCSLRCFMYRCVLSRRVLMFC